MMLRSNYCWLKDAPENAIQAAGECIFDQVCYVNIEQHRNCFLWFYIDPRS